MKNKTIMPLDKLSSTSIVQQRFFQLGVLAILCYISFFVNNGVLDANIMEARNFVTAREILAKDNWLVPTMNGEVRLTKPPLPTWLTALAAKAAGDINNLSALRFPAALMASLMVFFLYGLVKTFTKDSLLPFISGMVLATSGYIIYMGRVGTWDIYCHSFMVGALWAMAYGWKQKTRAYGPFGLAGLALGLSFMSKGPVSFYTMLLPFLISYIICYGAKPVKSKWKEGLLSILVCLIISGAWPLSTWLTVPEELLQVVQVESNSWINRHVRPFWFYWNFPIQIGLWAIFVIAALVVPYAKDRINRFGNYQFLLWWLLFTILLLSIVPEKKDRYLLPAVVPMALLSSYLIRYLLQAYIDRSIDKWDRILLWSNTIAVTIICFSTPIQLYSKVFVIGTMSLVTLMLISIVFAALGVWLMFNMSRMKIPKLFYGFILLMVLLITLVLPYVPQMAYNNPDYHSFKDIPYRSDIKNLELYSMGEMRIELVWDAGRKVEEWDYMNDPRPLQNLPIAVFSPINPEKLFSEKAKDSLEIVPLDTYDLNRNKSEFKHYFKKHLSIIKRKD